MKRKLWWSLLVGLLILVGSVSVTMGEDAAPEVKSLSLNQAIELALEGNHQVELVKLGVEKAQISLDQANFASKKTKSLLNKNNKQPDQDATFVIEVAPKQMAAGKIIAETTRSYTLQSIKFGVESAYYGVLRAEKLLEVAQTSYKRAEVQYKQSQAHFKVGTSPKMDVISAEAQLKTAEAGVNSAEAALATAKMGFNKTLGLNLDTPLMLADKFDFQAAGAIDLNKVIEESKDSDIAYVGARENYNISKLGYDYNKQYYTPNTFAYRDAEYQLKNAEVSFESAKADLELNIKKSYLDLKTAEENYGVLTKSLEQAKEAYRLNKLRFDVGMATSYDVLNSEEALKGAELGLVNALYNFNLAKAQFAYGVFASSGM